MSRRNPRKRWSYRTRPVVRSPHDEAAAVDEGLRTGRIPMTTVEVPHGWKHRLRRLLRRPEPLVEFSESGVAGPAGVVEGVSRRAVVRGPDEVRLRVTMDGGRVGRGVPARRGKGRAKVRDVFKEGEADE